jgi:hypothetical protein
MKKLFIIIILSAFFSDADCEKPTISFFCELDGKRFAELLSDTSLVNELAEMKVSLRVGLPDFAPERATVLQSLNKAGIPLIAWLLLPEEEGYWFNMKNGEKALARYEEFKKWTSVNNLKWDGIGIDLELDINEIKLAFKNPLKAAWRAYKRLYDNRSLESGKEIFRELIARMEGDGNMVESYIIPVIYDEREKGTTSFQKLFGIVDIETRKEIPMLYTSAMGNPGIIPVYYREGMAVGLGSTGGGVTIEGIQAPEISWENLERDLLIASGLTDEMVIFCLESSAERGFIQKIKAIDFASPAPDITAEEKSFSKAHRWIRFFLVILDHPLFLTIGVLAIIAGIVSVIYFLFRFLVRKLKRKPSGS